MPIRGSGPLRAAVAAMVTRWSDRLPEVARDVVEGYVSVEAARRDYGVVIDPVTQAVARVATAELRSTRQT